MASEEYISITNNKGVRARVPASLYASVFLSNNRHVFEETGYSFLQIQPNDLNVSMFMFLVLSAYDRGDVVGHPLEHVSAEQTIWQRVTAGWYAIDCEGSLTQTDPPKLEPTKPHQISNEITTRTALLTDDSARAETVSAYDTLDGYTTIRVKCAFTRLNHKGIIDKKHTVLSKISDLTHLARKCKKFTEMFLSPDLSDIPVDTYTPCREDFDLD